MYFEAEASWATWIYELTYSSTNRRKLCSGQGEQCDFCYVFTLLLQLKRLDGVAESAEPTEQTVFPCPTELMNCKTLSQTGCLELKKKKKS